MGLSGEFLSPLQAKQSGICELSPVPIRTSGLAQNFG